LRYERAQKEALTLLDTMKTQEQSAVKIQANTRGALARKKLTEEQKKQAAIDEILAKIRAGELIRPHFISLFELLANAGFVATGEICDQLQTTTEDQSSVQELVQDLQKCGVMVLDDELYQFAVDAWLTAHEPEPELELEQYLEVSLDDLLKVFDEVDEDETGFAPRLDLRTRVDDYIPRNARVQELSDTIRALDVMILERDDYIEIVEEWLRGGKQSEAPASEPEAAPAATEAFGLEFLLAVFDEVDEDETGFAPRLDLRTKVDEYIPRNAKIQHLSDTIRALDVMILERDDFEEIVETWLQNHA